MPQAKPRLWVISDIYYPEDVSTGHVMTRIAEGLTPAASVHVLCGKPAYAKAGTRVKRTEDHNGTHIRRVGLFAFPKDRLLLRALNVASFTLSALLHIMFHMRRHDRILCVTNPPTLPPLLALLARSKQASFVLLVHDVFPETAVAAGKLKSGGLVFRLLSALVSPAYQLADSVIVLGRDMKLIASGKRGTDAGIEVVENWSDLDEIVPVPRENSAMLKSMGWDGNMVVQVSGNLGRTHDLETLTSAANLLGSDSGWRWIFAGFGGKEHIAEAAASGSSAIRYLPRQPRDVLNELLGATDVHVIAFVPGMAGLSVPSRMYNIMAAGRPIIAVADKQSELSLTVLEEDIGWQVDPGSAEALAATMRDCVTPEACAIKGARARALAERRFSFASKLAAFARILRVQ